MENNFWKKKKKKKLWFEVNEDAKGYPQEDNRIISSREMQRRSLNF